MYNRVLTIKSRAKANLKSTNSFIANDHHKEYRTGSAMQPTLTIWYIRDRIVVCRPGAKHMGYSSQEKSNNESELALGFSERMHKLGSNRTTSFYRLSNED